MESSVPVPAASPVVPPIPANFDILKKDTDLAISRLSPHRRDNKRKAEIFVIVSAGISAATTVSIGLSSFFPDNRRRFSVSPCS